MSYSSDVTETMITATIESIIKRWSDTQRDFPNYPEQFDLHINRHGYGKPRYQRLIEETKADLRLFEELCLKLQRGE
jgi:hypothetical protein